MTRFKAIRNFLRRPGETVMAGDLLTLDDAEATLLVSLGAVLPTEKRDMRRVIQNDRVTWQPLAEAAPLQQWKPTMGFARRQ